MKFVSTVSRAVNQILASLDVRLVRIEKDFSSLPLDNTSRSALFSEMSQLYESWIKTQNLYSVRDDYVVMQVVEAFFIEWQMTPFNLQFGGSRFNNLLWLHLIAKSFRPDYIVDSGTYQGASAWALQTGSTTSRVSSYDISLANLKFRHPQVSYFQHDWTNNHPEWTTEDTVMCYFDDHLNQARRLIEASDRKCQFLIFDDDFPITSYYSMARDSSVLPKIEFILDKRIEQVEKLRWSNHGQEHTWLINHQQISEARSRIKFTDRLPFTGLVTGIHQTPYRIVIAN